MKPKGTPEEMGGLVRRVIEVREEIWMGCKLGVSDTRQYNNVIEMSGVNEVSAESEVREVSEVKEKVSEVNEVSEASEVTSLRKESRALVKDQRSSTREKSRANDQLSSIRKESRALVKDQRSSNKSKVVIQPRVLFLQSQQLLSLFSACSESVAQVPAMRAS
eukprot:GHVN01007659.1.p2 GENE.GHVN01007659.1~~GHVN01007659.1.p2  ORF type:complete len:163 (-),score=68.43 GHVN01007659.1:368-856(-)